MKSSPRQIKWCLGLVALTLCTILGSSCSQPNSSPLISSLQSPNDWVAPSAKTLLVCVASDADGDSLTYAWSATAGTFSGTGAVTTWSAPEIPGTYAITVKVTDGNGGEAATELTIEVRVNNPPVIESLTAEPPEVPIGKTSTINCVASDQDGDELGYQWSATRGSISGQGSIVTWIAPNTCGKYFITVTVADGGGGEVSEDLEIEVIKPG